MRRMRAGESWAASWAGEGVIADALPEGVADGALGVEGRVLGGVLGLGLAEPPVAGGVRDAEAAEEGAPVGAGLPRQRQEFGPRVFHRRTLERPRLTLLSRRHVSPPSKPMCPLFRRMCPVSGGMCPVLGQMCPLLGGMCPVERGCVRGDQGSGRDKAGWPVPLRRQWSTAAAVQGHEGGGGSGSRLTPVWPLKKEGVGGWQGTGGTPLRRRGGIRKGKRTSMR